MSFIETSTEDFEAHPGQNEVASTELGPVSEERVISLLPSGLPPFFQEQRVQHLPESAGSDIAKKRR